MNCLICETEIKEGESFYIEYADENDLESKADLHTDCLIRKSEFRGNSQKAAEIQNSDLTEGINRGR